MPAGRMTPNPLAPDPVTDPEDRALVFRAKSGDAAALEELVVRHQAWIYNTHALSPPGSLWLVKNIDASRDQPHVRLEALPKKATVDHPPVPASFSSSPWC